LPAFGWFLIAPVGGVLFEARPMTKNNQSLGYKTLWQDDIFRSVLESEWAKFFALCGIPYLYEAVSVKLRGCGDRTIYTPDFYLKKLEDGPQLGYSDNHVWFCEVKPANFQIDSDAGRVVVEGLSRLAFLFRDISTCFVAIGRPTEYSLIEIDECGLLTPSHFWQCPTCGGFLIGSDHRRSQTQHIEWRLSFHGAHDDELWSQLRSLHSLDHAHSIMRQANEGMREALEFLGQLEKVVYE
jgi:hypothetical protein